MESLDIILPHSDWTPLGSNQPYHFVERESSHGDILIRFEANGTYKKNDINSENKAFSLGFVARGAKKIHIHRLHIISNAKFLELYVRTSPDSALDYLITMKSKTATSTLLKHYDDSIESNVPSFEFKVDEELKDLSKQRSAEIVLKFLSIKQSKSGGGGVYFHMDSMEVDIGLLTDFPSNITQSAQPSMTSAMIGMLSSLSGHANAAGALPQMSALTNNSYFSTVHGIGATGSINENNIVVSDKYDAYQSCNSTVENLEHTIINDIRQGSNNSVYSANNNFLGNNYAARVSGEITLKDDAVDRSFKETTTTQNESWDTEAAKHSTARGLDVKELTTILWSVKDSIVRELGEIVDKRLQPIQLQLQGIEENVLLLQRAIHNNEEGTLHGKDSRECNL